MIGYRQSSGVLLHDLDDEDGRYERPLLQSIQQSIQGWATRSSRLLAFVFLNEHSDLLLVHRLLAKGLERAAAHSPQRVFEYLLGDPRRLVLGPYSDVHKESVALIGGVSPLLDNSAYARLERYSSIGVTTAMPLCTMMRAFAQRSAADDSPAPTRLDPIPLQPA